MRLMKTIYHLFVNNGEDAFMQIELTMREDERGEGFYPDTYEAFPLADTSQAIAGRLEFVGVTTLQSAPIARRDNVIRFPRANDNGGRSQ